MYPKVLRVRSDRSPLIHEFLPLVQEIVLAITAEYTDWSRPVQHPVHIRDLTAEALHDACFVSPVVVAASHLYTPTRTAFLYVLDHRPDDPDPKVSKNSGAELSEQDVL